MCLWIEALIKEGAVSRDSQEGFEEELSGPVFTVVPIGSSGVGKSTMSNILAIALEAKQLELERARMEAEDLRSRNVETTDKLTEEVSFLHVCLQNRQHHPSLWHMYVAAREAMNIIHPGENHE